MEPASEILDNLPHQTKTPLDIENAQPKVIIEPTDVNKIPPGQADSAPMTNGKDISPFRAEFSSPHIVMKNFPNTKGVIDPIMTSNDEKLKWLASTEREFADVSNGLSKEDRKSLTYILNGEEVPDASPIVMQKAEQARNLLDSVWDLADDKNVKMGFQDRYIT